MEQLIDTIRKLSVLPFVRQVALVLALAISVAVGIAIVLWSQDEEFSVLYSEMDEPEAAQIVEALNRMNVPYRIDERSGLISVPAAQKHELRLKLAGEGLPSRRGGGFGILYEEQQLGTSSFMEKARFNRALEEELAASIATLESVSSARVHLAIPKHSSFIRAKAKPNASVLVDLKPGRVLDENQMAGITYLVAASVPGLQPEKVTLVDQRGQLLSNRTSSPELMMGNEQFRFTQALEEKLQHSIVSILTPILGEGRVQAKVSADINFTSLERTIEEYSPESISLRSEQTVDEGRGGGGASGIPGAAGETDAAVITDAEDTPEQRTVRATRNYEIDHSISHIREQPGTIKKLSIAVVVDYRSNVLEDGTVERNPLTQEELDEISSLVESAVGYDELRGDTVSVTNAPFIEELAEYTELPEAAIWEQPWVQTILKQVLGFIAVLVLLFAVVRPLLRSMTEAAEAQAKAQAALPAAAAPAQGGGVVAMQPEVQSEFAGNDYNRQLAGARNMAQDDPTRVAQVIRTWVEADG